MNLQVIVLLSVISGLTMANICDRCTCYPHDQPITVHCNCDQGFQRLTLSRDMMTNMTNMKKFTASFCESVEFSKDSFAQVPNLMTVSLEQIEEVTLHMGVFSSLKTLAIEDVPSLMLEEKAFMGVDDLRNIVIRRSHILELPRHALFDTKGLSSLELEDVIIVTVKSEAVNLQMAEGSSLIIDNCLIEDIEENGLVLHTTREFRLTDSKIQRIAKNAINITSSGNVSLTHNHFSGTILPEAVHIAAPSIELNNNTIEHIPKNFLSNIQGPISFVNNTLLMSNLDISEMKALLSKQGTGNRIPCHCSQKSVISQLSLDHKITNILEQNLCIAPCNVSILEYPSKCPPSNTVEDDKTGSYLCSLTETTTSRPANTTWRTGRAVPTRMSPRQLITPSPRSSATHTTVSCLMVVIITCFVR